jgi:hypothetical protein
MQGPRPLSLFNEGDVIFYNSHKFNDFFLLTKKRSDSLFVVSLPIYVEFTFTATLYFFNNYSIPAKENVAWDAQEWLDNEVERVEKERVSILRTSDKLYSEINKGKGRT